MKLGMPVVWGFGEFLGSATRSLQVLAVVSSIKVWLTFAMTGLDRNFGELLGSATRKKLTYDVDRTNSCEKLLQSLYKYF